MSRNDPTVYVVGKEHGLHFLYNLTDVRKREISTIEARKMEYLEIIRRGRTVVELRKVTGEIRERMPFGLSTYYLSQPYREPQPTDIDALMDLMSQIPEGFEIDRVVDDIPTSLGPYGLDRPSSELVLRDPTNSLHLRFGTDLDDSHIHFQVVGQDSVFGMQKAKLRFMELQPFELVGKFAFIVNIDYVDNIKLHYSEKTSELTIDRRMNEEVSIGYLLNGAEIEEKLFKDLYRRIMGLTIEAEAERQVPENPAIILTYSLNRGRVRKYRLTFVPYDVDFYALFRNGVSEFLVSKQQVQAMVDAVEKTIKSM
jgi:hypothetical protein